MTRMPRYTEGLGTSLPDAIREIGRFIEVAERAVHYSPTKIIAKHIILQEARNVLADCLYEAEAAPRWEDDGGR